MRPCPSIYEYDIKLNFKIKVNKPNILILKLKDQTKLLQ